MKLNYIKILISLICIFASLKAYSNPNENTSEDRFDEALRIAAENNIAYAEFTNIDTYNDYANRHGLNNATDLHANAENSGFFNIPFHLGEGEFLFGDDSKQGDGHFRRVNLLDQPIDKNGNIRYGFTKKDGSKINIKIDITKVKTKTIIYPLPKQDKNKEIHLKIKKTIADLSGHKTQKNVVINKAKDRKAKSPILANVVVEDLDDGFVEIIIKNIRGGSVDDITLKNITGFEIDIIKTKASNGNLIPLELSFVEKQPEIKTIEFNDRGQKGYIIEDVVEPTRVKNQYVLVDYMYLKVNGKDVLKDVNVKKRFTKITADFTDLSFRNKNKVGESTAKLVAQLAGLSDGAVSKEVDGVDDGWTFAIARENEEEVLQQQEEAEDKETAQRKQSIVYSDFEKDKDKWANNGSSQTSIENGKLKVTVDRRWEGIRREITETEIKPGKKLSISVDFNKANTKAAVRLYIQEIDATGKHISWNIIDGDLKTGSTTKEYTVKKGTKIILRLDKTNTHEDQTTDFFVDRISIKDISKEAERKKQEVEAGIDCDGLTDAECDEEFNRIATELLETPIPPMWSRETVIDFETRFVSVIDRLGNGNQTNKFVAQVFGKAKDNQLTSLLVHLDHAHNAQNILQVSKDVKFNLQALKTDSDLRDLVQNTAETIALDEGLTNEDSFWPQNEQEWKDFAELALPVLGEVFIALTPIGDVKDVVDAFNGGTNTQKATALAFLLISLTPADTIKDAVKGIRIVRKAIVVLHKLRKFRGAAARALRHGFKTTVDSTGKFIVKKGREVIAQGDGAVKKFLTKIENVRQTGVKAVDDFVGKFLNTKNVTQTDVPSGYRLVTKQDGSKYISRLDASNPNTPRLMIDEAGDFVPYTKPQRLSSNGTLRNRLKQANGGSIPTNHQAHHLVPDNVAKNSPLHQEAVKRGLFDVDRASNGKILAETAEDFTDISKDLPTHFGSHPKYDAEIVKNIDDALRSNKINPNNLSGLSNQQISNLLDDVEDLALDTLETWKPSRLN